MTHEQKIYFIADKCAIANPRLKELGFGCEVMHKELGKKFVCIAIDSDPDKRSFWEVGTGRHWALCGVEENNKAYEIIGREPQLADVLMAMNKMGYDDIRDHERKLYMLVKLWNLSLGLYNQSLECIEFLYQLLNTK